jgi:hypothetical protein
MLPDSALAALPELVRRPLAAFAAEYLARGRSRAPPARCAVRPRPEGGHSPRPRGFLTEDDKHGEMGPRQLARALEVLGGAAAILAAARACVEVGRWFP